MDISGRATASIIDVIDRARNYFGDYEPDMKSVNYNYRDKTSEMTMKITVPRGRSRNHGKVRIPKKEGYRIKEMFTPEFNEVNSVWDQKDDSWILNPANLPSEKHYLVRLEGKVDPDQFDQLIDLNVPDDPVTENGVDKYWVQSALKDPGVLANVYEELTVENVDLSVEVGVQRCFTTAIPSRIRKSFERTDDLIEASNKGDRNELITSSRRRQEARKRMSMTESELAQYLSSLATSEKLSEYIAVEQPFKRRDIDTPVTGQMIFPEQITVDVSTNLGLDKQAAEGELSFKKEKYTEYLEDEAEDLV